MRQLLFDGGDASGIVTMDHILDLAGKHQFLLGNDLTVFDHIHGDIMVDEGQDIQIQHIDVAFNLQNILLAHLVASCILDDGDGAVQLVQLEVPVYFQAFSGFDMVQNEAFFDLSYI